MLPKLHCPTCPPQFARLKNRCENIVRVHGMGKEGSDSRLALVMELGISDAFEVMMGQRTQGLAPTQLKAAALQLASALATCHEVGIAHRDVKPENLVLVPTKAEAGAVPGSVWKLCDFGGASTTTRRSPEGGMGRPTLLTSSTTGSAPYWPPEVPRVRAHNAARKRAGGPATSPAAVYDAFAADVWSFAVTVFVLGTRHLPFKSSVQGDEHFAAFVATSQPQHAVSYPIPLGGETTTWAWPAHFHPSLIDLLNSCLALEPSARPTMQQVLQHPWLQAPSPSALPATTPSLLPPLSPTPGVVTGGQARGGADPEACDVDLTSPAPATAPGAGCSAAHLLRESHEGRGVASHDVPSLGSGHTNSLGSSLEWGSVSTTPSSTVSMAAMVTPTASSLREQTAPWNRTGAYSDSAARAAELGGLSPSSASWMQHAGPGK